MVSLIVLMMVSMLVWVVLTDWLFPVLAVQSFEKENVVPTFTEIESGYTHNHTDISTYPMVDAVALDITGDGSKEILVTGAKGQDNLYSKY